MYLMNIKEAHSNEVRIPEPERGVATAVNRYQKERAVILHPDDFHALDDLSEMVMQLAAIDRLELSDAAVRSHIETDTPHAPLTDPKKLKELFG